MRKTGISDLFVNCENIAWNAWKCVIVQVWCYIWQLIVVEYWQNCCDLQRDISKAGADGGAPRSEYLFKTSGELVRTGEYSFNTCGELVGICCVMKMMGSFSASIPDPKRQSDDRCVSAEKIMFKWYVRGCLSQWTIIVVGYSVSRDLQGEVRSRWVPGANGEKLRDRSTSNFFSS